MITDLPWQLWIILGEVWVSAIVVTHIFEKKFYAYTWRNAWWVLSDIGIIALLIWGGSPSWQHLTFGLLYAWAIFTRVRKTLRKHRQEFARPQNEGSITTGAVLIATLLTLLVVTG